MVEISNETNFPIKLLFQILHIDVLLTLCFTFIVTTRHTQCKYRFWSRLTDVLELRVWMNDWFKTDWFENQFGSPLCIYYTRSRRILVWCFFRCCLVNKWSNFPIYFSLNSTKKSKHWLLLALPLIFHRFVDTLIECDSSEMAIVHHTITYTCT